MTRMFPLTAWRIVLGLLGFLALTAAACSGGDASSEAERSTAPTPIAAPAGSGDDGVGFTLTVVDGGPSTGLVMTDYRGFAVYGNSGESLDLLVCLDDCTPVWIPLSPREGTVADDLDASLYTVFTRPDGSEQAAYAGVPLYVWTGDSEIGITGGAGVAGTWFALTEQGGYIE